MIVPHLVWPNLVLAKLGLAKLGLGQTWSGQTWSWPNLVWPNLVLAKLGLAKLGLGQTWFGQTWSRPQDDDNRQVITEHEFPATTEDNEEIFKPGWSALNYTITRLSTNVDRAGRNLLYICGGNDRVNKKYVFDNKQVIDIIHEQEGKSITISFLRECYTRYTGRKEFSLAQFKKIRDSHHDGKSAQCLRTWELSTSYKKTLQSR